MEILIKDIKRQMPDTKLFVSAVLPKFDSKLNPGINCINLKLFNNSVNLNYYFIQHPQFCRNGQFELNLFAKSEVQQKKPLHLSKGGVARLACNIRYAVKSANE